MTSGFQNQDPGRQITFPKAEPNAQHGRKPDEQCLRLKEKRSFQPRPGH